MLRVGHVRRNWRKNIAEMAECEMWAICVCRVSARGRVEDEQDGHNRAAGCQNQAPHQRQGEEEAYRAMLTGDSPSTHPYSRDAGTKAAWWWASRKVSSGRGLQLSLPPRDIYVSKSGKCGGRGGSFKEFSFASSFQGTCYLFFLWPKPKHHFDPISADSAWQRQFRLL